MAQTKGIAVKNECEVELDKYCDKNKHRGMILLFEWVQEEKKQELHAYNDLLEKETSLVLLLDGITDPHNYGAVLRSADKFGVDLVIIPERKSVRDTDTVSVTSVGANSYVNQVIIPNLTHAINFLKNKGFWVYGADLEGEPIHKINLTGKIALVMGSEGKGIRGVIKEKCDICVTIPCTGHIDSLNVSVAAGILLYEIRRQQGFI